MPFSVPSDLNREVTYLLRWPAWLARTAERAAKARRISKAAWLREAVAAQAEREAAQRKRYQVRPGRMAVTVPDLADLLGPAHGAIELPVELCWSRPDRTFSLDDPAAQRQAYEIVLQEARSPADLITWLNGEVLAELWPRLRLPRISPVRRAWEDAHPVLRPAEAAA